MDDFRVAPWDWVCLVLIRAFINCGLWTGDRKLSAPRILRLSVNQTWAITWPECRWQGRRRLDYRISLISGHQRRVSALVTQDP